MAMEMKLNFKHEMRLVPTPMLQQAIKLLQLSRLELAQAVHQEMIENPILEEILEEEEELDHKAENPEDPSLDSMGQTQDDSPSQNENDPLEYEQDWDNYFQDNISQGSSADNYTERPSIEATYKKEPTLADHLMWQLDLSVNEDLDKFIGSSIIGNIQNDGYCIAELSEIAEISQATEEDVLRVLKIIQTFEPNGVGARTLKECLQIQAKALPERLPLVETLIESYLERLNERYYQKIASELKIKVEEVIDAVKTIKTLDPKPGLQFSSEGIDYVVPDLVVIKTEQGYEVLLSDDGLPNVKISPYYHHLLKNTSEPKTKEYLKKKHQAAEFLIKSIDKRRETIYKVGTSIVKLQTEFLDNGLSHLKPMVLKDVARDIEMHESTVSRITTNKYIDTPQGIFELKFFFHSGIKSFIGNNDMSSVRVKSMIQEIIKSEDPQKPLTDDEMVEALVKRNAKIARRTVTKYRKELNILPASKRKKIY
ncbi:MAG: RNA polymerase factor sigma-54 [Nitrospinota bacterium]|nr:RNA polymerase factor sigma-54 [Nitrospinota bacterium]